MSLDTFLQSNASGLDYPSIRPTLNLNFAKTKTLDSRITYTRNSIGTYMGSDGYIKTAVANEPRFQYDPTTGECLGLFVEGSRTNLALYSQDLSQSSWINSSNIPNQAISPDGSSNAWRVTYSGYGGLIQPINLTSGVTYTVSVWLKAVPGMSYPPNTLTVGMDAILSQDFGNIIRTDVWTRCSVTFTSNVTASRQAFFGRDASGGGTYSVYAWGPQIEVGGFASSYIPTTTSTVTRQADDLSITGGNFSGWYNQSEGTYVANAYLLNITSTGQRLFTALSNDRNIEVGILFTSAGRPQIYSDAGQNSVGDRFTGLNLSSTTNKFAAAYKSLDFAISGNNQLNTNKTGGVALSPSITQCEIGRIGTTQYFFGYINSIIYYPKKLSDYQLQLLSK